jgi:hypothetical protein
MRFKGPASGHSVRSLSDQGFPVEANGTTPPAIRSTWPRSREPGGKIGAAVAVCYFLI